MHLDDVNITPRRAFSGPCQVPDDDVPSLRRVFETIVAETAVDSHVSFPGDSGISGTGDDRPVP